MTGSDNLDQKNLINELTQGRELAKQLQIHLNAASSSHEARELLVHKILNSYDKALSMLKWNEESQQQAGRSGALTGMLESPTYHSASPSEDSDQELKDPELRDQSKKRKAVPRWTQKVQVCPGTGLEGHLDDGYIWRKYGQKDILGAKYPRGYYRCTHRHVQGCLATKQVQRSDEDPTLFEITYRGRHTCNHRSNPPQPPPPPPPSASPQTQDPNAPLTNPHEILLNFRSDLRVITENLETAPKRSPAFSFPSTSPLNPEKILQSSPSMVNQSNFMGNYSPSLVSPATSGSSYFSGMAGPSEIAPASTTNSPTVSLDFPFGSLDQFGGPNFPFDDHGFFS
ncbi:hypothetical protein NMG60_11018041 [Bertholletia excelsa]